MEDFVIARMQCGHETLVDISKFFTVWSRCNQCRKWSVVERQITVDEVLIDLTMAMQED